jgi:ADP-ribosylglycohydrolase
MSRPRTWTTDTTITKAVLELLFRRSGDESNQRVREELLDAIRSRKRKREETA